jgi:hypothetical protein
MPEAISSAAISSDDPEPRPSGRTVHRSHGRAKAQATALPDPDRDPLARMLIWRHAIVLLIAIAALFVAGRPARSSDLGAAATILAATKSNAVDVALVLAVDASQSMDEGEQKLQREGYVAALTSPEVMKAISIGRAGQIAVTYFEWGSADQQVVVAPWTVIDGPDAAKAFAGRIAAAPYNNLQRTSISAALAFGAKLIDQGGFSTERQVIDVSGDGPNNEGLVVSEVRDRLVDLGITINGLPIVTKQGTADWIEYPPLDQYYETCVVGGVGSFSIPVRGMNNFGAALKMKLVIEIAGLNDPVQQPGIGRVIPAAGAPLTNCRYFE